jgi:hypothetical protein
LGPKPHSTDPSGLQRSLSVYGTGLSRCKWPKEDSFTLAACLGFVGQSFPWPGFMVLCPATKYQPAASSLRKHSALLDLQAGVGPRGLLPHCFLPPSSLMQAFLEPLLSPLCSHAPGFSQRLIHTQCIVHLSIGLPATATSLLNLVSLQAHHVLGLQGGVLFPLHQLSGLQRPLGKSNPTLSTVGEIARPFPFPPAAACDTPTSSPHYPPPSYMSTAQLHSDPVPCHRAS